MITGALPTEEKERCLSYLLTKYNLSDIKAIHITPLKARVRVEVTTDEVKKHYLKKKPCGNFEEYEVPMNDR